MTDAQLPARRYEDSHVPTSWPDPPGLQYRHPVTAPGQLEGGGKTGEPGPDDADVDREIAGQGRTLRRRGGAGRSV